MEPSTADAWIFLAIGYSSKDAPASLADVVATADWMDKSIPTVQQLQDAVTRLSRSGYVEAIGERFSLTHNGRQLLEATEPATGSVFDHWTNVEDELQQSPPSPENGTEWQLAETALHAAIQEHSRRVQEFIDRHRS